MTEEISDEKLARTLRQVRAMLERANHPNTPLPEAEMCRTRAESLMFKYRLDEATMVASGTSSNSPTWREMFLVSPDSEFATFYNQLAGTVLVHVGARGVTGWSVDPDTGVMKIKLTACGFSSDLNYMDMILTAAILEFGKRLEPTYEAHKSDAENIYAMRSAGMERNRIARALWGEWDSVNEMKQRTRKVTKIFKEECERRGEDAEALLGRGNSVKTYRTSYAEAFVSEFWNRLYRLRQNHALEEKGLVLMSRKEAVDEAYYLKYPQHRPRSEGGSYADPRANCERCKRAKSGYCRDHQYMKPSTSYKEPKVNRTAQARGRFAAQSVDIGNTNAGRNTTGSAPARGAIG
jgi:hypothetical protein